MTTLRRLRAAFLPFAFVLAACTTAPEVVEVSASPAVEAEPVSEGDPVSEAEPVSEAGQGEVEPYVVKGRVVDAQGDPMAGVEVGADNTLLYDSNALAVTDAAGAYRIDLSAMDTSWRMWGQHRLTFDGQEFRFDLAVDESPFASSEGAIRDFTWQLSGPYAKDADLTYGGTGWVYEDFSSYALEDLSLVTLTMVPIGPLVDGSAGQTLSFALDPSGAFDDVPIGRYTLTATYDGQDLLVRPRGEGEYAGSAEVGFSAGITGGDLQVEVLASWPGQE